MKPLLAQSICYAYAYLLLMGIISEINPGFVPMIPSPFRRMVAISMLFSIVTVVLGCLTLAILLFAPY